MSKFVPNRSCVDDIFYRLVANLPLSGGYRENLENEWKILDKRLDDYYVKKNFVVKKVNKKRGV